MNVWNNTVELAVRVAEDTAFDPNSVSPGVEGFIFTGLMAVAVIGLGFVLVRRMRKNEYRHEVREQIEAELAEQTGEGAPDAAPDRGDAAFDGAGGVSGAGGVPDAGGAGNAGGASGADGSAQR